MIGGLLIVLGPMFFGYLIKTHNKVWLGRINTAVMLLLYLILLIMGLSLGQMDDLAVQLPVIAVSALTFIAVIMGLNIISLLIYDKISPRPLQHHGEDMPSRLRLMLDSLMMSSMVLIGFILGFFSKEHLAVPLNSSTYVLVMLIFLIGIQLRNNGIGLREVLFNKRGIYTSIIVTVSALFGGMLAASLLGMPLSQGLAIASGIGWYSLSSVMINDAWGPVFGSIAFFNDLSREILSLFLVPFFMRHHRSTAVGITGATALDCTLPVIQRSGGMQVVPLAISYGFIINILVPILLVFFIHLPL
ncbi:membrane protein [Chelonobacter oris]|uniref:Membrane protein n=1 Tax=Chelonobacter oris TaxID=505317 RepID=A0A0A3AP47_9PAST|nr:lysine exporter LysO family protein [Chelonobacter oris]KGQ71121.1 membrane protein [Chelonobacter oris]